MSMQVLSQNLQNLLERSNSLPNSEVLSSNLAILPSKPSSKAAKRINKIAKLKFPSNENLIELIPRQTPTIVRRFGKMYLDFFVETILNVFFSCLYSSAIKLSPA